MSHKASLRAMYWTALVENVSPDSYAIFTAPVRKGISQRGYGVAYALD
jgi:hypothetical protein